jgi:hypothetical protein
MEEEAPTDYGKGGYLRVAIGDRLGHEGRYVIKRKLGYVHLPLHCLRPVMAVASTLIAHKCVTCIT